MTEVSASAYVAPNALHAVSAPGATWSSINLAEAVPGVMTPLCASVWVPASELGLREPFVAMGALPRRRGRVPDDDANRITNAFYGRMAVRVDFLCEMGDLIPGHTGEALARDFFGFVPSNYRSRPSYRRLPFIVANYPRTFAAIGRRVERLRHDTDAWWRREVDVIAGSDIAHSQRIATDARDRFFANLAAQAVISATVIQPVQEQLSAICNAAGVDPAVLLRGSMHEEGAVLDDLWATSRGILDVGEFVRRHGYHGTGEGEVQTRVWREDPETVRRLVKQYAARPDAQSPHASDVAHRRAREQAERTLMASAGPLGRLRARLLLRLGRRYIPLRGTGKVAYLQGLDVLRAAARRLGALLTEAGRLTDPEDAFYLTADELIGATATDPAIDLRAIVAERRTIRRHYQSLNVPTAWTGRPEPAPSTGKSTEELGSLSGIGACAGVVEGRAVVIEDPADAEIADGDILVARTTDPSWVALMFLSGALVVDIGGLMSHAAVVARELGVPCVMNTSDGTTVLRTGDVVRVDGAAGTVEILSRGTPASTTTTERTPS